METFQRCFTQNPGKFCTLINTLDEGLWRDFIKKEAYKINLTLSKESLFWDSLIERLSHHILTATVGRCSDLEFEDHEKAVRCLAAENRYSRYILSKAFLEKFKAVPSNMRGSRLIFSPNRPDKLYIFLYLPRDENQDYQEYMKVRLAYIHAYALVAKYLNPIAKLIIVLATETKEACGRSEDVFALDYNKKLSSEENQHAISLINEQNILTQLWKHHYHPFKTKNSPNFSFKNKKQKINRNEKCPCGSGKKFKNCCIP